MSDAPSSVPTTGLAAIDGEHRLQARLIEAIERALSEGRGGAEVETLLDQLVELTNVHFLTEQLLMRFHSYPLYEAHVAEHDTLISHIQKVRDSHRAGDAKLGLETLRAIRDWHHGHVGGMDRTLAEFVVSQPARPPAD